MKKLAISILLCAALIAGAAGCGQSPDQIAFFIYDESDTFVSELMQRVSAMVPEGVAAETWYASNSQVIQNQQIVSLVDTGGKLFAINAVDRLACGAIAEKCAKSGVDVIFFNREPAEDVLIAGNSYQNDAMAVSILAAMDPKKHPKFKRLANLRNAQLENVGWGPVVLPKANFTFARCAGAWMAGADLSNAILGAADGSVTRRMLSCLSAIRTR